MSDPAFEVMMRHGRSYSALDLLHNLPAGQCVTRARLEHLRQSEWIVVSKASRPVGFAAYKRADGEVRVVHEFLLDSELARIEAATTTEALVSSLEMVALEDGVTSLTFLLRNRVVIEPFEARGYISLVLDDAGIWLQRKLERPSWGAPSSMRH